MNRTQKESATMGMAHLQAELAKIDAAREVLDCENPTVLELSFLAEALDAAGAQARVAVAMLQVRNTLQGSRHAPR